MKFLFYKINFFKSTIIEFSFYDNRNNKFLTDNQVIQSLSVILNTVDANNLGIINITVLIFNYTLTTFEFNNE